MKINHFTAAAAVTIIALATVYHSFVQSQVAASSKSKTMAVKTSIDAKVTPHEVLSRNESPANPVSAPIKEASGAKVNSRQEAEQLFSINLSSDFSNLSRDELKSEVEALTKYVDRENAISRLNENSVNESERSAWGHVFERLLALRSRVLALEVEQAKAQLASYKAQHEARVQKYIGSKS